MRRHKYDLPRSSCLVFVLCVFVASDETIVQSLSLTA
jgi:hypothetical protein